MGSGALRSQLGDHSATVPDMAQLPLVRFASSQVSLKGEDIILMEPRNRLPGTEEAVAQWNLPFNLDRSQESLGHTVGDVQFDRCDFGVYAVFDGHNGPDAAAHCKEVFLELLTEQLPQGPPPSESDEAEYDCWREDLQRALAVAFSQCQHTFASKGIDAGTTATVVLQVGWLVTCANVGDSLAFIDNGIEVLPLTADHRINSNTLEQARVNAAGGLVTNVDRSGHGPALDPSFGIGSLRIWPGGMANSRAIGDFTAGNLLLSSPHISQVLVPPSCGARIVIASDGVWDGFHGGSRQRVAKLTRRTGCASAASRVINTLIRGTERLKDDTTVVVVDLTPPGNDFPGVVGTVRGGSLGKLTRRSGSAGSFSIGGSGSGRSGCCFSPPKVLGDSDEPGSQRSQSNSDPSTRPDQSVSHSVSAAAPKFKVFAEIDTAYVLNQLPDSAPAPAGPLPSWPHATLSMAMVETQEHAHSVFARAAMQRRSMGVTGIPRGGSYSLLNILAAESEERSVRLGRGYGSVHGGSLGLGLAHSSITSSGFSPAKPSADLSSQDLTARSGSSMVSFSEDELGASPGISSSLQSTPAEGGSFDSLSSSLRADGSVSVSPLAVGARRSSVSDRVAAIETLADNETVRAAKGRRSGEIKRSSAVPLKSALRKSTSGEGRPVEMTAMQLSERAKG